jgi:hypothetical protein
MVSPKHFPEARCLLQEQIGITTPTHKLNGDSVTLKVVTILLVTHGQSGSIKAGTKD